MIALSAPIAWKGASTTPIHFSAVSLETSSTIPIPQSFASDLPGPKPAWDEILEHGIELEAQFAVDEFEEGPDLSGWGEPP